MRSCCPKTACSAVLLVVLATFLALMARKVQMAWLIWMWHMWLYNLSATAICVHAYSSAYQARTPASSSRSFELRPITCSSAYCAAMQGCLPAFLQAWQLLLVDGAVAVDKWRQGVVQWQMVVHQQQCLQEDAAMLPRFARLSTGT